jgi:hypothetical protein
VTWITHRCEYVQVTRTLTNKTCYIVFLWTTKIGSPFDCIVLSAKYVVLSISFSSKFFSFYVPLGCLITTKMWIIEVHIWNAVFWIDMPLWKESIHLKLTCSLVANCDRCWIKHHIWINKYNNRVRMMEATSGGPTALLTGWLLVAVFTSENISSSCLFYKWYYFFLRCCHLSITYPLQSLSWC